LILLDLNLPDMHGAEVLRRLQERPRDGFHSCRGHQWPTPRLHRSSDCSSPARAIYLTKPIDVKQFLVTVDEILRQDHVWPDQGPSNGDPAARKLPKFIMSEHVVINKEQLDALLATMLQNSEGVSDLLFVVGETSPGRSLRKA